jgi:hypothetical protein
MAHYAFLDDNNVVTEVIVGKNEGEGGINWELKYGAFRNQICKRTSYNTRGGIHYDSSTGEPSEDQTKSYRKNYAGIGYKYDQQLDAFIPPKPFESWTLNEETCLWESPTPMPNDDKLYFWNEETGSWEEPTNE